MAVPITTFLFKGGGDWLLLTQVIRGLLAVDLDLGSGFARLEDVI